MYKGKKKDYFLFNKIEFIYDLNWVTSFVLGINTFTFYNLKKRVETFNNYDYDFFIELLQKKLPLFFFFFNKYVYNIFFLDMICTYKGYRHCHGLPVRGQRTWTNANSCYKSNTFLRQFRIVYFKKFVGSSNTSVVSHLHMAEQINLLWKIQWDLEWKEAKKKQKKIIQEKKKGGVIVDLQSMSKKDISGFSRRGSAAKKKMYKQKKNQFTLGFDVGFTKQVSTENNTFILN